MRNWLRIDPATFLASLVGGLLPAVLLIIIAVISYYSLAGVSLPALEQVHEERAARARNRCTNLARDVERRIASLSAATTQAVAPESALDGIGAEWDLVSAISCYRVPDLSIAADFPELSREMDQPEAILAALHHENDVVVRSQALTVLAALPAGLEDPIGFSYSTEAALLTDVPFDAVRTREILAGAGRLDAATWSAAVARLGEGVMLPGVPLPITPVAGVPPVRANERRLSAADPARLLVGVQALEHAMFVLVISAPDLLERGVEHMNLEHAGEGRFTLAARAAAQDIAAGAGKDSRDSNRPWPLEAPFTERWQLVDATPGAGAPVILELLERLKLTNYLWLGVAVLVLGSVACAVLAVIVSRRVRLSRSKDDFLRLVSHELRTPIAAMRVLVETLSLGRVRDGADQQEVIRLLDAESGRLSDLVERVLEYGRTEGGRARVREVITDPGEIVNSAVKIFEERHTERSEITVRTAQEFHPVVLDREAVIRVVLNLLSNARKFAGAERPIEVTVGEESFHLFIEVRDEGPGIARREQRKIFRSFYRSNHNSVPGFGLGLAYCREVAEAHRGKMRVRSTPGRGAAFTLEIPLVHPQEGGGANGSHPGR